MAIVTETNTTTIADSESQGRSLRKRMWPSFETAVWLYDTANIFLLIALAVGVIATGLVIWMGNVKEEYLRRDVAGAHVRAAEANERAATAQLKLENLRKQIGPRIIDRDASLKALEGKPTANAEILFSDDDRDSFNLALQIFGLLKRANWEIESPKPVLRGLDSDRKKWGNPMSQAFALMSLGAQPWSVSIVTRSGCVWADKSHAMR